MSDELSEQLIRAAALWPELSGILEAAEAKIKNQRVTPKERKAIKFAADHFGSFKDQAATLRKLLERLGGGR